MGFYSKARLPKPSIHDPAVKSRRLAVLKAATINLIVLQLLFLGLFCYIFGSLFQQTSHTHNINILFVDYDGGAIGAAVRSAYQELKGPSFPTLDERPALAYPDPNSIDSAVCNIKFWGALYITANSTNDLNAALAGGTAASSYNASDVLTLVWNEARYPTAIDSAVYEKAITLSQAARVAYMKTNGKQVIQSLNSSDNAALSVFSNPWTLTSVNIQPTTQGSRLIYNTIVLILIMIQEFFYLGYVNGLYSQFNLYGSVKPHRIAVVRQIISGVYTFVGSLCVTGAIWAFRNGWNLNGGQFMLSWMVLWLFAHLNFLVLDTFTVWISPPFVPMALISWMMLNVTSVLLPFELSPAFYKWGYALPAHSVFNVLIDIWSRGCNPQLYYGLPVLFVYEILGITLSSIGVYRRAHYAAIKQEKDEKDLEDRITAAIAERELEHQAREETTAEDQESKVNDSEPEEGDTGRNGTAAKLPEGEVRNIIRREMSRPSAEPPTGRTNNGPCFDLPFSE
ncbi:Nitrosoguanidine resistance protein SNG1 [Penicillium rolfsii]|nr:Nitrosoguanidine resistance protein SNG1 [Penicillium rolfsii]